MKKKYDVNFPRGLSPKDRERWHELAEEMFEMYAKMPFDKSPRKVVAGGDGEGNACMFFVGTKEDCLALAEILKCEDKQHTSRLQD